MTNLYHVVAMARNRVIGKGNQLPWHFAEDLKHFKALTTGHAVIMGRKTFESIGRPLSNRTNIVLTRSKIKGTDPLIFHKIKGSVPLILGSWEEALKVLEAMDGEKAFIIGGAEIYKKTLDRVNGIYATQIDADYEGDAYYPEIPPNFDEKERRTLREGPRLDAVYYENRNVL